jgi:hypothetical protein
MFSYTKLTFKKYPKMLLLQKNLQNHGLTGSVLWKKIPAEIGNPAHYRSNNLKQINYNKQWWATVQVYI